MSEFVVVSVLLSVVALGFALLPFFFSPPKAAVASRDGSNLNAFKLRLQELEDETKNSHYSSEEQQALKQELELRLLDEINEQPAELESRFKVWPIIVLVVLLLPVGSWALYQEIGAKDDFDLAGQLAEFQQAANEQQLLAKGAKLVTTLEQRLLETPDSQALYMTLGRTQTRLQRYTAAVDTFQRLMALTGEDPVVMGLYAQARFMANGRQLDEVAQSISHRVLEIQPNNGTVLGMLGMASFEQQDYRSAVNYWQQLYAMLPPDSPTAQMIQQGISKAQAELGDTAQEPKAIHGSLTVNVSIAEGLTPPDDAFVFIYARAVNGPKMPLAVVKKRASELPMTVKLDQSMAMSPAMTLANFEQVELVARVSTQGIANSAPGDMEGVFGPVSSSEKEPLTVIINRVLN